MMSKTDHAAFLSELSALLPADRAAQLRAHGNVDSLLLALGDEAEKLVVVEVARAISSAELVLALADEVGGPASQSRSRRALGQALAYSGEFNKALEVCNQAIEIADNADETVQGARARLASIHALGELGHHEAAIEAGMKAYEMLSSAGEHALAARADLNLGVIFRKCDNPAKAVEHFNRARPHLLKEPGILAQLDSNRGEALLDLDNLEGAEEAFTFALSIFEKAEHNWGAAIVEGNLADLATRQGRLDRSLYHFESARRHIETDKSPTHLARLLIEQADAKAALGMLKEAAADYEQAVPVLREHQQPAVLARALAGLARVYFKTSQSAEAEKNMLLAISEYSQLGNKTAQARLKLLHSEYAQRQENFDLARELATSALTAFDDNPIDAAIAHFHIARLDLNENNYTQCKIHIEVGLEIAKPYGIASLVADLTHAKGKMLQKQGEFDAALVCLREAVNKIERVRGTLQADRFRAAFLGNKLDIYETYTIALLDQETSESIEEAFQAVERAKSRSLLDVVQGVIDIGVTATESDNDNPLLQQLSSTQRKLNNLYRRIDEDLSADRRSEIRNSISKLEDQLTSIESRLSATQGVAELFSEPSTLNEVQHALASNEALLEFFTTENMLNVILVTTDSIQVKRNLCDVNTLNEAVEKFHFQIGRAVRPGALEGGRQDRLTRDAQGTLKSLYDVAVKPALEDIDNVKRLLVVPHGSLHTIPFASMWDGKNYLIEKYELVNVPSASLFVHLTEDSVQSNNSDSTSLVVSVADEHAPYIAMEGKAIAAELENAVILSGEKATVKQVSEAVTSANQIHFACHGRFDALNPLGSGLRMSDRWMTVRDIYRLKMDKPFVVLSGCETGINEIAAGDELIGLVRAFLAAGATGLAVSLWVIEDAITTELMCLFQRLVYNCRTESQPVSGNSWGSGVSGAMREAQLNILRKHPHPVFWAPFVLVGR